ncbi:MAG: leucyl aminopeptidase [candidate division Zixibacteria bacterium]
MKLSSHVSDVFDIADKAVAIFCYKNDIPKGDVIEKIDILTGGTVGEMFASGEFDGSEAKSVMIHQVTETMAGRFILAGLGEKKSITFDSYRKAAGIVGKMARSHKIEGVSFYYDGPDTNPITSAIVEGFVLGSYHYENYKTDKKEIIKSMSVVIPQRGKLRQAEVGLARGEIISEAVTHCRDLVNIPGNNLYPEAYAKEAARLAKKYKFKCKILSPSEIKKEKMGALLSVSKGSDNPPRFVILEYNGKPKGKPVVIIGKGVTFDSGGLSLKTPAGMVDMKNDMTGSAVVLNVITAAARLNAKINLIALMPLVENMPSGKASRPGDVVISRAGHSIEIISTDAEGRMILADALDYAEIFDPQAIIDIATLTGGTKYILGYTGAVFAGNNKKLIDNIHAASFATGERVWDLPIWKDFEDAMKSDIADLKNSGGADAGTLKAAAFLKKFVKDRPWAHIDIAYVDLEPKGLPYIPKGATGFGVRLLLELLMRWKKVS